MLNKVRSKFGQPIAQVPSGKVTLTEMKNAEREILMSLQRKFFAKELKQLSKCYQSDRTKSVNKSSSISRLDPMLKNGLLLVGGRLRHTRIQMEARNPIILPKKSHVVDLIVRNCHEIFGHVGREHVLSLLREKFWPVKGPATVRRVLNACFSCRKRNQLPMTQKMADLPHERVASQEPVFTYIGVDCFGPFHDKRGRCLEKRHGVPFTCFTIRAVHVEIAHSLDTRFFINALRRFIARRGVPQEIISDNGINFMSADKELRQANGKWNQEMIKEFLQQKEILWVFNPPTASHIGGVKRGRCLEKRYGVPSTCLTIRAVYAEIAHSLDTSSFINALHRFVARRGVPQEIRSDNGTNFTSADKELRQAIGKWNQEMIKEFLEQKEILWVFNPPTASHMGKND